MRHEDVMGVDKVWHMMLVEMSGHVLGVMHLVQVSVRLCSGWCLRRLGSSWSRCGRCWLICCRCRCLLVETKDRCATGGARLLPLEPGAQTALVKDVVTGKLLNLLGRVVDLMTLYQKMK